MSTLQEIKLDNIDSEDIGDVLVKLEKSFEIRYNYAAFKTAKTFGDICDVIEAHINHVHQESCTAQQAFYKVRKAISESLQISERDITLESELEIFFPRDTRRRKLKKFQQRLNIKFDILKMKEWLVWGFFLGFVLSFISFFFGWRLAVTGLFFFTLLSKVASVFSNELAIRTVRQLAEKLTKENYSVVRRTSATVNRNEIFNIIQETFSSDLDLDKSLLTRDASLGWK